MYLMMPQPFHSSMSRSRSRSRSRRPDGTRLPHYIVRTFSPVQLRHLHPYRFPVLHTLICRARQTEPLETRFSRLFSERLPYYEVRPMRDVSGGMWFVFVPPFCYKNRFFETVFVAGDTLQNASVIDISTLGAGVNDDCVVSWTNAEKRGKLQCKVHRLLAFSLLYNCSPEAAYQKTLVVHHKDWHHDNNLLSNLQIMPKRQHDRLQRPAWA